MAWVALLVGVLLPSVLWAHDGSHGSSTRNTPNAQASQPSANHRSPDDLNLDPRSFQPPHGGQVVATKWHFFEVVYTPQETRLYMYSPSKRPLYAKAIKGEAVMTVNGNPKQFRYPLKPVVNDSLFGDDMGYAVATVDVTRVRDGDMQVTFELELSSREEPRASFTQTFALTRPPVQVTVARLTEADRPLVERQRMCPVMEDSALGSHGTPIKLMVGNQPLFVCCEGCIGEVKENPRQYLEKTAALVQASRQQRRPQVNVFWAVQNDDTAIRAQGVCPVMNQPLGAHGRPLKVVIDGRPIFVCCQGCIDKAVQNRDFYFSKLADATDARRGSHPPIQQVSPNQQAQQIRHITVGYVTEADRPAVQAQGVCPVMNQPLGSHGTPIKVAIGGQPVFVCCQGCVGKVEQNPDVYLSKVVRGQQPDRHAAYGDLFYEESATDVGGSGGSCCSGQKKSSCCH